MTTDIFKFWSRIKPHQFIHPADVDVFNRVGKAGHGLDLRCLPSNFGGRLKTAPIVLLFLSPGFGKQDLVDARSAVGRRYYAQRRKGTRRLDRRPRTEPASNGLSHE